MKSDTPRADATSGETPEGIEVCETRVARQLERELNEAKEKIAKLETDLSKSRSEANFWLNYP